MCIAYTQRAPPWAACTIRTAAVTVCAVRPSVGLPVCLRCLPTGCTFNPFRGMTTFAFVCGFSRFGFRSRVVFAQGAAWLANAMATRVLAAPPVAGCSALLMMYAANNNSSGSEKLSLMAVAPHTHTHTHTRIWQVGRRCCNMLWHVNNYIKSCDCGKLLLPVTAFALHLLIT